MKTKNIIIKKWRKYLPNILIVLEIPFISIKTVIMRERIEYEYIDIFRLYWRVYKWSGEFNLYWKLID